MKKVIQITNESTYLKNQIENVAKECKENIFCVVTKSASCGPTEVFPKPMNIVSYLIKSEHNFKSL